MKKVYALVASVMFSSPILAADAVADLQATYQSRGATSFSTAAGEAMWGRAYTDSKTGETRRCSSCHGTDLRQAGKHATTGKPIEPMAPSANPSRLTDIAKIEKWFLRNCKWTLGRECSAQEKGDFLAFIKSR
jgi:hypothetical protein